MNVGKLLLIIFVIVVVAILGFFKNAKRSRHERKRDEEKKAIGEEGEQTVISIIESALFGQEYEIENDTMIDVNNRTSQIDHVVINQYGVFVIETKNYSGVISGNEEDRQWIQYVGGYSNSFYSPVKQNETHCAMIERLLHKKANVFNVVVFVKADISNVNVPNVCDLKKLYLLLKNPYDYFPDKGKKYELSSMDISKIKNQLVLHRSDKSEEEHIQEIEKIKDREIERKGACPYCGGRLVVRKGKYSKFLGCANYPKCTYKEKYFG